MYPSIIFKVGSLDDNIRIITNFYNTCESDIKYLYKGINKDNIDKVVSDVYNLNLKDYQDNVLKYTKLWNKYSNKYFEYITSYLNIDSSLDNITCKILLLPIFPRNLSDNSFYISPNMDDNIALDIIRHEITHFYWFKKFKSVYPNISEDNYNIPNLAWIYSEMVIDPILNQRAYDEFYDITYDGNNVMDYLKSIYNLDISIEDKIIKGYEYIKKVYGKDNYYTFKR